jgi:predicted nuclease with TOPRIM domain
MKKNQEFAKIEEDSNARVADEIKNKEALMDNLKQEEHIDESTENFENIDNDNLLMDEMEKKRREEEQFRLH